MSLASQTSDEKNKIKVPCPDNLDRSVDKWTDGSADTEEKLYQSKQKLVLEESPKRLMNKTTTGKPFLRKPGNFSHPSSGTFIDTYVMQLN